MLALTEALLKPDVNALSSKDILHAGIETERLEVIPLNRIITESALIDEAHAAELGISMKQKRGQITPIAVRARIDEEDGEVTYDIIDGFHRTAGKKINGDSNINATVIYGCADEEMYDLRILAVSSVRSVQFARVAEWITNSFATTPWAEKGLSVSQAFHTALKDSKRSNTANMTPKEMIELKDWAKGKCNRWGKTLGSIYQDLRVVDNADPGHVKEVRFATGGTSREVKITQAKLALVVNAFPGKEHHLAQREILHFATANRLKIDQIKTVVENLRGKIQPGITEKGISELIRNINLERTSKKGKFIIPTGQENAKDTDNPLVLKQKIQELELRIKSLNEVNNTLATRLAKMSRLQNPKPVATNAGTIFERLHSPSLGPKLTIPESQSDKKPANNFVIITKENVNSFIPKFTDEQMKELEGWELQKLKDILATVPKSHDMVSPQKISLDLVQAVVFIKRAMEKKLVPLIHAENSDYINTEVVDALQKCIKTFEEFPGLKNIATFFTATKNVLIKSASPA